MVEHLPYKQDVIGSIPVAPTKKPQSWGFLLSAQKLKKTKLIAHKKKGSDMWYNEQIQNEIEEFEKKTENLQLRVKEESRKIKNYQTFIKKRKEHQALFLINKNDMSDVLTDITHYYLIKLLIVGMLFLIVWYLSEVAKGMQYIVYFLSTYLFLEDTKEYLKNFSKVIKIRQKIKKNFIYKIKLLEKNNSIKILKKIRIDEKERQLLLHFYEKEKLTKWDENYLNNLLLQ